MKKRTKWIIAIACLVPVVLIASLVCVFIIGPPGPHFACHRELDAAFEQWWLTTPNGRTTNALVYPNVDGSSVKSLEVVAPYIFHGMDDLRDYRYVPGLTSRDPGDVILMYVNRPSSRSWHGDMHWFRRDKRWVVLSSGISLPVTYGREWSELAVAITTPEFKRRLRRTIDYLKENNRPNWQTVEKEHGAFLNTIKE